MTKFGNKYFAWVAGGKCWQWCKVAIILFFISSCTIYNKKNADGVYSISWEKLCVQENKNKYGKKVVTSYKDYIEVTINNLSDTTILFPVGNYVADNSNFYLYNSKSFDTIFLSSSEGNIMIPPKEKSSLILTRLGNWKGDLTMDEYQKGLSYIAKNYNLYYQTRLNKNEEVDSVVQDIVKMILSEQEVKAPIDTIFERNPIMISKKKAIDVSFVKYQNILSPPPILE